MFNSNNKLNRWFDNIKKINFSLENNKNVVPLIVNYVTSI